MPASKIQPEQVYAIKHDDRLVRFYVKAVVTDIRQITPRLPNRTRSLRSVPVSPMLLGHTRLGEKSAGRAGRRTRAIHTALPVSLRVSSGRC
jgi:hypothetical protein